MSTCAPRSRARHVALVPAALVAVLLALSGCSSASDGDGDSAPAADEAGAVSDADRGSVAENTALRGDAPAEDRAMQKAIISKGSVSVVSDDVEKTAFEVQRLADEYGGEVSERETGTDEEGEVRFTRIVLRVPAEDFEEAFTELEQVADLESSSSSSEDVTTQVIDNQVRIRAQRRSIQRIEVLLDRAQSIRDIVSIEAQLTRRQAALDSLEQQQAYLRDQTSMSTIAVHVERTPDDTDDETDTGFVAGLTAGWKALVAFGTGLATAAGAALPFAVVLAVLGLPLWVLIRRLRRRSAPAVADAQP